jgi:hypothetical protein
MSIPRWGTADRGEYREAAGAAMLKHGRGRERVMRTIRKKLMQSRWGRLIPLAGALALMTANASAQTLPKINLLGGDQKRPLTPEEQEQQKKLDDNYKAATNKIPNQKANDPWADVNRSRSKKEAAIS